MQLPGGFSPTQALRQVADTANPFDGTDTDYDVFGNRSFNGGVRDEAAGSTDNWLGGGQGTVNPGYVLGANNGYNFVGTEAAPAPAGGGGGGGAPAPVDPYARWGGQAGYNATRNNYGTNQNTYKGEAQTGLRDVGNTYDSKTNTFVNDIETGQGDINRGFAGNALNLRTSMANIVRGIQQGIRSGGVALAGMNAMDSGASDALARAYAKVGNTQSGEARGEAALQDEELMRSQGALNQKRNQGEQDLGTWRDTETSRVRNDFGSKLDTLFAQADAQGVGDVVQRGMVDEVLNEAMSRLQQIDQRRQTQLGGVKQWTPDEVMKEAIRMENLGQTGTAFDVTGPEVRYGGGGGNLAPINGAPLGNLPIYTKGKDDLAVTPQNSKKDTTNA